MEGFLALCGAAKAKGFGFRMLGSDGLTVFVSPACNAGNLTVIGDDPDPTKDASKGPGGFSDDALRQVLSDARVTVCSAVMGAQQGSILGLMLVAANEPNAAVIVTNPQWHVAWSRKVVELVGREVAAHITPRDFDISQLSAGTMH